VPLFSISLKVASVAWMSGFSALPIQKANMFHGFVRTSAGGRQTCVILLICARWGRACRYG
jgi:hypothetical protein